MVSINPFCYIPSVVSQYVPTSLTCPPPPSYLRSTYEVIISPFGSTYTTIRAGMDALLSLPLLSFLIIPTMTSYSTSLNLLFFYLTWSTLVLSHPPLRVEIVASLAVNVLFYIIPSMTFLLLDILFPGVSESFKSLGTLALPFKNVSRNRVPEQLKILGWAVTNILIAVMLQAAIEYTLVNWMDRKPVLKVTTSIPLPWAILKDLLRGFLMRDFLSFLIHKYTLHNSHANTLTRDLTRLHTTWYHAQIRTPYPLSATYDHPIAYILRVFIPAYFPSYFWRFHLLTYILFQILIALETTFTHSGYSSIPTNFVLGGIARRNDLHCLSEGHGNFGTWGVVDWLVGANLGGDVAEDLVAEVEEAHLQRRVSRRAGRGVQKLRASNPDIGYVDEDGSPERVMDKLLGRRKTGGGTRGSGTAPKTKASESEKDQSNTRSRRKVGAASGSGSGSGSGTNKRGYGTGGEGNTKRKSTMTTKTSSRRRNYDNDDDDDSDYRG